MKAQISFVEYLVAFLIFITFIGYFSIQILKFVPEYLNQIRSERIRSEAYQISEILINDPGFPANWDTNPINVQRLGFSDETKNITNFLSIDKLRLFGGGCPGPGYNTVKELIASDFDFSIMFIEKSPTETVWVNCHPEAIIRSPINTTVRRIFYFDSGYGELIVQMW